MLIFFTVTMVIMKQLFLFFLSFVYIECYKDNKEDNSIEIAHFKPDRILLRLNKILLKFFGEDQANEMSFKISDNIEADSLKINKRKEFGIPVKTKKDWEKLADKVKRREKRKDMKHWKPNSKLKFRSNSLEEYPIIDDTSSEKIVAFFY